MMSTAPRHRRPATLLAVAAAAAVVLAGCGSTDADHGSDLERAAATSTSPSSTTDGSVPDVQVDPAATTEVPRNFPLAAGLPATNDDDGSPVVVTDEPTWTDVKLCGEVAWSRSVPVATTDLAGASYTGAEDVRSRLLALYDDELGAQQALDGLRDAYADCPDESTGGTDQVYEVVEADQGSATITHRYRIDGRFDTGLEVIELVAIGNAFYLSSYYGEGGGSDETIASMIEFAHEESRPVWKAMASFA